MIQDSYDRIPAWLFCQPMKLRETKPERIARKKKSAWWRKYKAYLASKEWAELRRIVIASRGRKCEDCGMGGSLRLHHKNYERMGHEKPKDLELLCVPCHQKRHPNKKIR